MSQQHELPPPSAEDQPLEFEPGHVMRRRHYEDMAAQAAAEAAAKQK